MKVRLLTGVTPREEVRQPASSCWPRWCARALLESTAFSLTKFTYGFTFSPSLSLFHLPPHGSASPSSSSPASGGQGRGTAPREPGAGATDRLGSRECFESSMICFPCPGRLGTSPLRCLQPPPTQGLGRGQPRGACQGCACVRRQSRGRAVDDPVSSGPFIS